MLRPPKLIEEMSVITSGVPTTAACARLERDLGRIGHHQTTGNTLLLTHFSPRWGHWRRQGPLCSDFWVMLPESTASRYYEYSSATTALSFEWCLRQVIDGKLRDAAAWKMYVFYIPAAQTLVVRSKLQCHLNLHRRGQLATVCARATRRGQG